MRHASIAKEILKISDVATDLQRKNPLLAREDAIKQAYDIVKNPEGNMVVGDIVICKGWEKCKDKKGFIEEIVVDPKKGNRNRFHSGRFSVYGLEPFNKTAGSYTPVEDYHRMPYFGDFVGADLEPTGEKMTAEKIKEWAKIFPDNKGLQADIIIIIKNLGRASGRNEK